MHPSSSTSYQSTHRNLADKFLDVISESIKWTRITILVSNKQYNYT